MGRQQVELKVVATTSRHNSEQDKIDEDLWEELCARVQAVVSDPKFEPIGAWVV